MTDITDITGVYFDMPFKQYLEIPALSNSGIKDFLCSPYRFWTNSWMNPERPEREEKPHHVIGEAYHCRVLEGQGAFESRFCTEFDPANYPLAINTADDIKNTLRDLKLNGYNIKLTGNKTELINRILEICPEVQVLDVIKEQYYLENSGKKFLSQAIIDEIEKAALMAELHSDAKLAFSNGYPEVTVIWYDDAYGILHKSRFDYLKIKCHSEYKTFENIYGVNIDRIPARETAKYKYHLQYTLYIEAAAHARKMAKEGRVFGEHDSNWIKEFSEYTGEHKAVCVFQQKDICEIRGKIFGKSMTMDCAKNAIESVRCGFIRCMEKYGEHTPWIDPVPFSGFEDEEMPVWMTE